MNGLGNIVYGGRTETGLSSPVKMDSLRLAIPRETYSTEELYLLLSKIGKAFKEGVFEKLSSGLVPENYLNDGFYHFKGKYKLKDEAEFLEAVERIK